MSEEFDMLQKELEAEAGGKILNNAMVRIQAGTTSPELSADLQGLLVLTEERLLFKHYAQDNWFSGMFSARNSKDKAVSLGIDFSDIVSVKRYVETSLFRRLFFRSEPFYSIEYRDKSNILRTFQLIISFCKSGETSFFSQLSVSVENTRG